MGARVLRRRVAARRLLVAVAATTVVALLPASAASARPARDLLDGSVGSTAAAAPVGQSFGGDLYGVNPTIVASEVNSSDGALEFSHSDLTVAGIGVPFVLARHYNSQDTSFTGAFGPGWASILDLRVSFAKSGAAATVYGEDGQQVSFAYNSSSKSWTRAPGVRASLTCSGPATNGVPPASCTVTRFVDGVNWTLSNGKVQDYLTASGQGLHFRYTSGRISSITVDTLASSPFTVSISRNSAGEVTKVATPTRSVLYSYSSSGDLASVTDARGNFWQMSYDKGHRIELMKAYPTPSSTSPAFVLAATYDSTLHRVHTCEVLDGTRLHTTTFSWSPVSGQPTSGLSQRLEARFVDGSLTYVDFRDTYEDGVLVGRMDPEGGTAAMTWNSDLDLVQDVNPLGSVETMTYDSAGDETSSVTKLDDSGQAAKKTYTYDADHRLVSSTDPLRNTTSYTYTAAGELASETKPGDLVTRYSYTSTGLLHSATDPTGDVTTYSYDAAGNQTGEVVVAPSGARPVGNGPISAYDEAGDRTLSVPPTANLGGGKYVSADATRYLYDADGELTETVQPGSLTTSTSYDAAGNVTATTNPAGQTTTYTYSLLSTGALQETTTSPIGTTVDLYDPSGLLVSDTPPQPAKPMGHGPVGTTTLQYDSNGDLANETGPNGDTTSYVRDALGDVTEETQLGVVTDTGYNLVGWPLHTTTTSLSYPADSGTPGTPTPDGRTTSTTYDAAGDPTSSTDAIGGVTTYGYSEGHLVRVSTGSGNTTYHYGPSGLVSSMTAPAGGVTTYGYDALGDETSRTVGGHTWSMTYDTDGALATSVDPDGRTAAYAYDALGRKTSVHYGWRSGTSGLPAPAVAFTYNALGQRTSMKDGLGTHAYAYDARGRLVSVDTTLVNGTHRDFAYNYTTPGQLVTTYPDGTKVTDSLDDGGNLLGVSVPKLADGTPAFMANNILPTAGVTQGATAPPTGSTASSTVGPTGTAYGNGLLAYTFNQPMTINASDGSSSGAQGFVGGTAYYLRSSQGAPVGAYEAVVDANSNVVQQTTVPISGNAIAYGTPLDQWSYSYNNNSVGDAPVLPLPTTSAGGSSGIQLSTFGEQGNADGSFGEGNYSYDHDGNLTMVEDQLNTSGTAQYNSLLQYNSLDQITSDTSNLTPPQVFSYDKAGDALRQGDMSATRSGYGTGEVAWAFAYNAAGELAQATTKSGPAYSVSYGYDGDGNLVSESAAASGKSPFETVSLIDDTRPAVPQLAEADVTRGSTTTHQRYLWGNGALGLEEHGTYFVFHDDHVGTPLQITNRSGGLAEASLEDPYGNLTTSETQTAVDTASAPVLVGFQGSYRDPITGLDDMGARWYNPDLAQFLSRDPNAMPAPGTPAVSPYCFAGDNPLNLTEATGLTPQPAAQATSFEGAPGSSPFDASPPGGAPSDLPPTGLSGFFSPEQSLVLGAYHAVMPVVESHKTILEASKDTVSVLNDLSKMTPQSTADAAAIATEARAVGTVVEQRSLALEGGVIEGISDNWRSLYADGLERLGKVSLLSGAFTLAAAGYGVYETVEACNQYGNSSNECISAAIVTAVGTAVALACDIVTAGAGSVFCDLLQIGISFLVPIIVGNFGVISRAVGGAFTSLADFVASGVDELGSYFKSGIDGLVGALQLGSWGSAFVQAFQSLESLGSEISSLADSIGSGLCDLVSKLECLF